MKKTKRTATTKIATAHKKVRHHVKMAVVPHKKNQFRPHLVRAHGVVAVLAIVASLVFGSNWLTTGSVLGDKAVITTDALLQLTNVRREQQQLPQLHTDSQLSRAAFLKAQDMFTQQYWAHDAPDGTTPWQWFAKAGYNYSYAGENLAKNFTTADATVSAWMASAKHRDNLLGREYTDVGFAVVDGKLDGKNTTLIVALFGRPASAVAGVSSPVENTAPVIGGMSIMTQFGVALQSMTPAALSSVLLLLTAAIVALMAHTYRRRLPMAVQRTWQYHHGLFKAVGFMAVVVMLLALYSGGQI